MRVKPGYKNTKYLTGLVSDACQILSHASLSMKHAEVRALLLRFEPCEGVGRGASFTRGRLKC